jgi:SAM-dependent methyltransferase
MPTDPSLLPPQHLVDLVGGGDYRMVGESYLRYFVDHCGLRPDHRVLDVGCGSGRIAAALTTFLDSGGSYDGFDVVDEAIAWCEREISRRFSNFRFRVVDVQNRFYRPDGAIDSARFTFPYVDRAFDFVFLTSVFTHVLPETFDRYLSEIARVLRTGGKCLMTFFLLNGESWQLLLDGKSRVPLRHYFGVYTSVSANAPEASVSYDEGFVLAKAREHGLEICRPIDYGNWCGRPSSMRFQDVIVTEKVPARPGGGSWLDRLFKRLS